MRIPGLRRYLQIGAVVLLLALLAQAGSQIGTRQAAIVASSEAGEGPRMAAVSGTTGTSDPVAEAPVTVAGRNGVVIGHSVKNDVSLPLRSIKVDAAVPATSLREMPEPKGEEQQNTRQAPVTDPVVQRSFGDSAVSALASFSPGVNFDGVGNIDGVYPPDTNGDVGPNHFVQWVNLHFQIWNKAGTSLYGPAAGNTLWSGFGGACQSQNAGDPVVLYDSMADRWLMSQFTSSNPYGECIAISTTPDPTGSYYRYFFQFSTSVFYDYPHLGVWPDGYYMGANRFGGVFQTYQGPSAIVFDRAKMLQGLPATYQEKQISSSNGTLLPSDLDGPNLPPAGSPNFFGSRASTSLNIWKFSVNWATPASTTFTGPTSLPVAAYNQLCSGTRSCVPQPGTTVGLDGLGDRLMHRFAYRNFGDHESLVATHSVDAGGGQAAVRWYEVRNPGAPTIYQQGTFAPDATNRWLGSVAMDGAGNMALGYSVSSSSVYPGINYTGRLAGDPLSQMTQGETTLIAGSGSQTGTGSRWGDYAMMTVDPTDDCTFWMTTEYMPVTGGAPWKTRIGSFRFASCGGTPPPTATPINTPVPPTSTLIPTDTPVPPTATATSTPNPNPADFTLSATPASRTIVRSGSTSFTVSVSSVNGFAGNVNLSVSGLPAKATATFSPNPVTGGSGTSTLTITTQKSVATGNYSLNITGTSGSISHSANVTLTINR